MVRLDFSLSKLIFFVNTEVLLNKYISKIKKHNNKYTLLRPDKLNSLNVIEFSDKRIKEFGKYINETILKLNENKIEINMKMKLL